MATACFLGIEITENMSADSANSSVNIFRQLPRKFYLIF